MTHELLTDWLMMSLDIAFLVVIWGIIFGIIGGAFYFLRQVYKGKM